MTPDLPSPGRYIAARRHAAGMSLETLAGLIHCEPPMPHRDRVAMLRAVEADERPLRASTDEAWVEPLPLFIGIDPRVLWVLVAIHAGVDVPRPALCRLCLCSERDPCLCGRRGTCAWSTTDASICTVCEERMALAAAAPPVPAEGLAA